MRPLIGRMQVAFWIVILGVIAFYAAGLVMGVFNPVELWIFTAVVVALIALFVLHEVRVLHVLHDENAPGHDDLRRTLNRMRETRGF